MLQGPNKLKNYRLRWLSKPLRLAKFEFFWIQVYSIVAILGYQALFFYFLWVLDSVFSMILLWFPIAECPMMLVASPLLQCHFRGTRAPIMPAILMADSFPISHNFPLFGAVSLKATCWLSISGCPWRVDFPFHLDSTFGCPFFLLFFPSEPNPSLPGWRFFQLLLLMVLLHRFPKVPAFCSRVVALQALWFFAASLGAWEGHICPSFLVFRGTLLELSQSHFNCVACLEDPKPLVASGDLDPIHSTGLFLFYPLILASWAFFFLPFVSWALRPIPSWILGFKSFGLAILFPCGGLNLFNITFHGIGPSCYFFGP